MTHQKDLYSVAKAQAEPVKLFDSLALKGIKNFRQALNELILAGGHSHESIAHKIGKRKEQISKFSSNTSGLKGDDIDKLINECNSLVIAQYIANKYGYVVVESKKYEAMKNDFIEGLLRA